MNETPRIIDSDDFEIVARRIETLAKSTTAVALIRAELEKEYQALLAGHKSAITRHERTIEFAETVIYAIAREHPEWFAERKTLSTPFGSVHSHKSTSHKVPNEEHTIRLIKAAAGRCADELEKARLLGLIRVREEVDIEAVEKLGDRELKALRIVRVTGTSLSVKIAKAEPAKKARKVKTKDEPSAMEVAA